MSVPVLCILTSIWYHQFLESWHSNRYGRVSRCYFNLQIPNNKRYWPPLSVLICLYTFSLVKCLVQNFSQSFLFLIIVLCWFKIYFELLVHFPTIIIVLITITSHSYSCKNLFTALSASTLIFLLSILYTVARVIFFKCASRHCTSRLKLFNNFPLSLEENSSSACPIKPYILWL